ncbi:MAG: hypothetical protein JWL61_5493 [Gemmatimonadetes bacterium]|nr:hypothetical protein [Gemmatimonadota bacterium]
MITGHLGIAAAARSFSREPMGSILFVALLLAAIVPDAVDALYWVIDICSPYGLYSHTTYAVALEAAIIGGLAFLATRSRGVTLTFVLVVLLHSPADYFTGRKLFVPGGEMLGLRMYERPIVDWMLEVPLVIAGWWLLRRSGRSPRWAASVWAIVALVLLQATLDAFVIGRGRSLKPNGCPVVTSPVGA